ncbi:aminotransferase-like domain-containing protein [Alkaliphilus peptidifermentans]|uniref:DNA-binding transcriptional regulator, MocR family, contains an aminotransferase domain n=1 Tax=Alkaliphilus peptidifermentans DSM 18978 TaxID=1120976 RepID=A0A1G5BS74_9FIRM|nr:PLP-dependent aminotransferase family protein [Alkaliphilus peptidifermentans]SCX93085.1 DNA-binding transcriptional regulator, MocR family, contains an aminotransferase domain [Alkaliphilus peptidifermentans DSM 18978]
MPVNSFENYPMTWKPVLDTVKPLYRSLANQLEQDIINGRILPGTKLPPYRELADFLDINVSTVTKAFKVCILKGLISTTVGSGAFVSFDALSNAYLLTDGKPKNIIEMGATIPEPASYEPLMAQFKNIVSESDLIKYFRYNRPGDVLWQKDAAVKFMLKGGYTTNIETILFASGGQNAITAALIGLCQHGDKIGTDPHTYSGLKTTASMLGIQLVPIKYKGLVMDENALIYACKNENLKGIYLIPDYQNPTTHIMSIEGRKALARIAKENNIFIIEDAAYSLMHEKPIPAVASFAPENTIYIASMSKAIGPGLRLAYVSVPLKYKKPLSNALYNMNISVSPLMAELAARMIVSNQFDTIIQSHRKNTIERNQLVNDYLSEYDCLGEKTCIFRWLKLPGKTSATDFEALALKHCVQVYGADRFAVGNSNPEKAVRLSICAPETIEELEKGLKTLRKLLSSIKQ